MNAQTCGFIPKTQEMEKYVCSLTACGIKRAMLQLLLSVAERVVDELGKLCEAFQ